MSRGTITSIVFFIIGILIGFSAFPKSNGKIKITVADGEPPYTYHWSNGATTQNLSNITAGTYSVVVHDAQVALAEALGAARALPRPSRISPFAGLLRRTMKWSAMSKGGAVSSAM